MDSLIISNIESKEDWGSMLDYLASKYKWNRISQPLCISLDCSLEELVKILNLFTSIVDACNTLAPIEINYCGTIIFKSMLTIVQGVIEPRYVNESENINDLYHLKVFESSEPYLLKIV